MTLESNLLSKPVALREWYNRSDRPRENHRGGRGAHESRPGSACLNLAQYSATDRDLRQSPLTDSIARLPLKPLRLLARWPSAPGRCISDAEGCRRRAPGIRSVSAGFQWPERRELEGSFDSLALKDLSGPLLWRRSSRRVKFSAFHNHIRDNRLPKPVERLAVALADRYRIESELGDGCMATG